MRLSIPMLQATIFNLCIFLYINTAFAFENGDPLERRASWQASFKSTEGSGMEIKALKENTPLSKAGLQIGDKILHVDHQQIGDIHNWHDISDNLVGGKDLILGVEKDGVYTNISARFNKHPLEKYDSLFIEYGHINNGNKLKQRTILTFPKKTQTNKKESKLAAIFFVQGLSCSSIEVLPHSQSNYSKMIKMLVVNANMFVMRVEKPGMGDSNGKCSQTDFKTELEGYELALQKLMEDPRIDNTRILVYGNSLGSAIAPYLVNKFKLNGLISDGTYFKSWFEHMLEIERRIKQMSGLTEAEISKQMNTAYIPLYYGMLIQKRSYAELTQANPLLTKFNYHGPQHMYGRPMSFYHQLQDFDVAGEWQKVSVPVHIRYGENDWIMSREDNNMIVDSIRNSGNNNVNLTIYPKMDHWSTLHPTATDSFNGKKGEWDDEIALQIVKWAQKINAKARREE